MKEKISSVSLDYGDALFHLYQFNHFSKSPNSDQTIHHEHRFYEIHIARGGAYTYEIDGKHIDLRENQMLIIPPDVSHAAVVSASWDYEFSTISLSLDKMDGENGFFSFFHTSLNNCALKPINVPQSFIRRASEFVRGETYSAIKGECYMKMQSAALVYELFEILNHFGTATEPKGRTENECDRLILLDTLLNDPGISLYEIAEKMNYSTRHTARLIKSIYGSSISEIRKKQKA